MRLPTSPTGVIRRHAGALTALAMLLLVSRAAAMAGLALMDTTEARYAEIARLMALTGDYVTPWFEPGVPFWGKPPLSFWVQAASIRLFGPAEGAVRLPSLIAMAAVLVPLWAVARRWSGKRAALCGVLVFSTCTLPFVMAGAVLTDPFLAVGTTLVMAGLLLDGGRWRFAVPGGIAIALLAKGPMALALVAAPMLIQAAQLRRAGSSFPMRKAVLQAGLAAALALPWYALAELRTPGFLDYFILGEHLQRFLDPGCEGDRYGTAHLQPRGRILLDWCIATLPWGPPALVLLAMAALRVRGREALRALYGDRIGIVLLVWALWTPLFFVLSRNILWTYVLPALPAFSILFGRALVLLLRRSSAAPTRVGAVLALSVVPLAMLAFTISMMSRPWTPRSERGLIAYVKQHPPRPAALWYVESLPFSAQHYSLGQARRVPIGRLKSELDAASGIDLYFAIPYDRLAQVMIDLPAFRLQPRTSDRYALVYIPGTGDRGGRRRNSVLVVL